ncbi:MAG: TonB-dependent receptor family protein [Pseudomonadales bacterium]
MYRLLLTLTALGAVVAHASEDPPAGKASFERMTVVGSRAAAQEITGAANYLSLEDIEVFQHTDVMRVLRQVPGVYVVEEEGYGLRPNIGLRGSGTDRSARIALMEDGVLIAPAPYAAAASYYVPTMARIQAVEIRKGSAAVRSGPRTTGGAINLISTPIPDAPLAGKARLLVGEDQTLLGHAHVGGRSEHWGFLLEGVRQQTDGFKGLDGGGDTGYQLDDYRGKFSYRTGSDAAFYQELEVKLGRTDQTSDETYLGLTDEDFQRNPYRRYRGSALDEFVGQHDQLELRHYAALSGSVDLTTVVYRNEFARNWYKGQSVGGASVSAVLEQPSAFAEQLAWLKGSDSPDDAIVLRNNNREYLSEGVQSILGWTPAWNGPAEHTIEFSVRYHQDEEDRLQDDDRYAMRNGQLQLTTDGLPGSQANRLGSAQAWSFYLQDEIRLGQWIFTPGLRYEAIDLERRDYATTDPRRQLGATAVRRSSVNEWIPGMGILYQLNPELSLLASVHRGFNPPGPGSDADSETSVNYEAGLRYASERVSAEAIGFFNDYNNLVGTCTISSGGDCVVGDQFDGGAVEMYGLELSASGELAAGALRVPLRASYTYSRAEFQNGFDSDLEEWGAVAAGDQVPYLPRHQLQLGVGLAGARWRTDLSASYVDQMRVVAGSGRPDRSERVDDHWIVDLAAAFDVSDQIELFARIENLLDDTYVVSRRPAGTRPGRPQTALIGVSVSF